MAIWTVDVDGLEGLIRAVARLPEDALKHVEDSSMVVSGKIASDAQAGVPVSKYGKNYYGKGSNLGKEEWNHPPGFLKKSIKARPPSKKRKNKYYVASTVGFGKGAAYGIPLELGHDLVFFGRRTGRHIEGRPFLRNAADKNKGVAITTITAGLNQALDQFSK